MAGRMQQMKETFEKSLVTLIDIPAGRIITEDMIGIKKPGTGIPARRYADVLGSKAAHDLAAHQVLQEEDLIWKTPSVVSV